MGRQKKRVRSSPRRKAKKTASSSPAANEQLDGDNDSCRPKAEEEPDVGGQETIEETAPPPKKKLKGSLPVKAEKINNGDSSAAQDQGKENIGDEEEEDGKAVTAMVCPDCSKKFTSKIGFNYHTENKVCQLKKDPKKNEPKNTDVSFTCPHCNNLFTTEKRLANHIDKRVCIVQGTRLKRAKTENLSLDSSGNKLPGQRRKSARAQSPKRASSKTKTRDDVPSTVDSHDDKLPGQRRKSARAQSAKKASSKTKTRDDVPSTEDSHEDNDFVDEDDGEEWGDNENGPKKKLSPSERAAKNFEVLKKGSKFITKYGVVEVIADDRLPPNRTKSIIDPKKTRSFLKRRDRFRERKTKVTDVMAAGARHRREDLKNMYLESRSTAAVASTTQKKLWDMYCKSVTPSQILVDGLSWGCSNEDLAKRGELDKFTEEDPRCPKDHYPDRIVECKIIEDKRTIMVSSCDDDLSGDDDKTNRNLEIYYSKKAPANQGKRVPMRVFISRRELNKKYDSSNADFACARCGQHFPYKESARYHVASGICHRRDADKKDERQKRIEAIESTALSDQFCSANFLTNMHGAMKVVLLRGPDYVKTSELPPEAGNPHKIKEFKKHKMPPWLVFNDKRSSMYPEIYVMLEFRRGSQNRNHFNKKRQEAGYAGKHERNRINKQKRKIQRMMDPGSKHVHSSFPSSVEKASVAASATKSTMASTAEKKVTASAAKRADEDASIAKKAKTKRLIADKKRRAVKVIEESLGSEPPACPPLPPLPAIGNFDEVDLDFGFNGGIDEPTQDSAPNNSTPSSKMPSDMPGAMETINLETVYNNERTGGKDESILGVPPDSMPAGLAPANGANDAEMITINKMDTAVSSTTAKDPPRRKRHLQTILVNAKKQCVVIDTQVLAAECESGRYPSINRFCGEHELQCTLCKEAEDSPMINCDFCKNSVHQLCLDKRMLLKDPQVILRESEPDDAPMCHECINTCLNRRWRAENRRETKWQHELSKAGLGSVPKAASLTKEVNIGGKAADDVEVAEGTAGAGEEQTYGPCPDGGPGGLICCAYCTAAYSRFLSNTAKEMEAQSVARVGQEVSEILELLADAKRRLQRASGVLTSNEQRRGLLDKNQTARGGGSLSASIDN